MASLFYPNSIQNSVISQTIFDYLISKRSYIFTDCYIRINMNNLLIYKGTFFKLDCALNK